MLCEDVIEIVHADSLWKNNSQLSDIQSVSRGVTIHSAHETRRDTTLGSQDRDEILTIFLRKLQ